VEFRGGGYRMHKMLLLHTVRLAYSAVPSYLKIFLFLAGFAVTEAFSRICLEVTVRLMNLAHERVLLGYYVF
jgi:hypothetical protein